MLHDIHLQIAPGSYVAILGHNGSGKSTLARLFNGLHQPTEGTVMVNGMDSRDPSHLQQIRRTVGMVFQHPDNQMVATMVEEDVAFGLENLCMPRADMKLRVTESLQVVGMEAHRRRPPHQLSGGQKQRVAIASVIAMRPRCIVFDEATSMLDAEGRSDVLALMEKLHNQGITIVTITHHMEEAAQAQRIVLLERGRVVMDASPRQVFSAVESLRNLHLDVPIATDFAFRLKQEGVGLPLSPLTPKEFADALGPWTSDSPKANPKAATSDAPDASQSIGDGPIIQVRNLSHVYMAGTPLAQTALQDVSLDIYPGEIVAFVGHTGSGKSTLVQHLNGLLPPQQGQVVVNGISVRSKSKDAMRIRATVGVVFQHPEDQLFETLIGDDVAYGPFQFGLSLDEVRDRVRFAMETVGLDFAWRDRPTHALSGGERRKVALAGVIALMPKVLVLDEPTAGLDPVSRDTLLEAILRLNREHGMTIIFVTHQMEEVARLAQRVFVFADGKLKASGMPKSLFANAEAATALHLGQPEPMQLLSALSSAGWPVDECQFTRDAAYEELWRVMRGRGTEVRHV